MQKLTLSQFIAESGLPSSLVRSTVRQCGGWQMFQETARNLQFCGADCGFVGFVYHYDTIPFAKRNKKALLELCKEQAEDYYGRKCTIYEFIAGFNCLKGATGYDVANALLCGYGDYWPDQVYNALAWYALEEVARRYCDIIESFD